MLLNDPKVISLHATIRFFERARMQRRNYPRNEIDVDKKIKAFLKVRNFDLKLVSSKS
jgi:hypothetical protein